MKFLYQLGSEIFSVEVENTADGFRAQVNGETREIRILRVADGELTMVIDGKVQTLHFAFDGARRFAALNGRTFTLTLASGRAARRDAAHAHSAEDILRAPMPGQVRVVKVTQGEEIAKGQTLLVLEAMKMEIQIHAPRDGHIEKLSVQTGDTVEREQVLVEIS